MASDALPPTLAAAHDRVRHHAEHLIDALDALDDVGGMRALAPRLGPARAALLLKLLAELGRFLDDQVGQLREHARTPVPPAAPDFARPPRGSAA
jgi:hypothetical protein